MGFSGYGNGVEYYQATPRLPLKPGVLYQRANVDDVSSGFDAFLTDGSASAVIVYRTALLSSRSFSIEDIARLKSWKISSIHFVVLASGKETTKPIVAYLPEDDSAISSQSLVYVHV
jgi:hypothetical protein